MFTSSVSQRDEKSTTSCVIPLSLRHSQGAWLSLTVMLAQFRRDSGSSTTVQAALPSRSMHYATEISNEQFETVVRQVFRELR